MAAATPAGWYEDPTGRFEHRYWDGTSWSDNVSRAGTQFQDPIADDPTFEPSVASTERQPVERGVPVAASAPTATVPAATGRTCPHCLAQTTAGGDTCPSCGKKFKSAAKWPWVLVALCALMVIGFFGCVALVGTAADRAITTADRALRTLSAEQARHAITRAQFDAVDLGSSRNQVLQQLGKPPANSQDFSTSQPTAGGGGGDSACISYYQVGATFGNSFQFCFVDNTLVSKNSY